MHELDDEHELISKGSMRGKLKLASGALVAAGLFVGGWGLIHRAGETPDLPNAAQLLHEEALCRGSPPAFAEWSRLGTNALPLLCRALGREDAPLGRFFRALRDGLARRTGWSGPPQPSPAALRTAAARAVAHLGPQAAPLVPELMSALARESDPEARAAMIVALGQIGPAASIALPQLERLRHGVDEDQIRAAREAVDSIE